MQTREEIRQNLQDAGCPESFIHEFLQAMAQGTPRQRRQMLDRQRRCILDRVHDQQKKLECLDYLRYQMKHEEAEET